MRLIKHITALLLLLIMLGTAGCTIHKPLSGGVIADMPERYHAEPAPAMPVQTERVETTPEIARWWERFGDERLNLLMEKAFKYNHNLRQAYERLKQAEATLSVTDASRSPILNIKASLKQARTASTSGGTEATTYKLSADASYEIDLWQRIRLTVDASALDAGASLEDLKAAYLSISAELADLYYLAVEQRAHLALLDMKIVSLEDRVKRLESRYNEGLIPAVDIYEVRQRLTAARAERLLPESSMEVALNALSVLTGQFPGDQVQGESNELPKAPDISAGIPSQLLAGRPDIRAARLRLNAADKRVGAAIADRFPTFDLTGSYGGSSNRLKTILDMPNIFWSILFEAAQPLLDSDKRTAEVMRTEAVLRESISKYHHVVLVAFQEVDDALVRGFMTEERILRLEESAEIAENIVQLSMERYNQGLSDYIPVLIAEQSYYDSRRTLLSARRQLISDRIQLMRSLGGDWMNDVVGERMALYRSEEGEDK